MEIKFSDKPLLQQTTDATILFLEQNFDFSKQLQDIANHFFPTLQDFMKESDFTGKAGSIALVPCAVNKKNHTLIFIGLGKKNQHTIIDIETYRRALGRAVKTLQCRKLNSAAIVLPPAALFGVNNEYLAMQSVIIAKMAAYHFDTFITDPDRKVHHIATLDFVIDSSIKADVERGAEKGAIIGHSVNEVRHWIDLPAGSLSPMELADKANAIARHHNLKITILSEDEIKALGMGGLAGVSAGSDQDAKLVIMEYKTTKSNAQTIAFVGKGITFDSGGLSLKPAASMETMKEDMSGAAAVIGAMQALAQLKPDVNIIAVAPLSENMPSGKATKPGDILRFYNGKTAEVKNTDAEGRLVLADALSYTVKHYKPDAVIDLATLTGACAYALGPFFTGMMSQHEDFAHKVEEASKTSGDRVWSLPFDNDYKAAIKSSVADICNIGSSKYKAGAITAGFFLQNFVGETPWVHLDIAGTAFDVPDISYYSTGATGVGVRLLVDLAMQWK
jgi:leucyl aminopeptidase